MVGDIDGHLKNEPAPSQGLTPLKGHRFYGRIPPGKLLYILTHPYGGINPYL
jgi:hypothetical protein